MNKQTVAIIGGGAAGMMAAASLIEAGSEAQLHIFERNDKLGAKVIISGGGRCNVTTGVQDLKLVLKKYPRGSKFLTKAMYRFSPTEVYRWFEAHGVPLKTEEDLRVFPVSDNGRDIVGVFQELFDRTGRVQIHLKTPIKTIEKSEHGFILHPAEGEVFEVDTLVLTTGGQAYRHTGSQGDGYTFAEALGHRITPLAPSLSSFLTAETWPKGLSGLSFQDAVIAAPEIKAAEARGPFLFTHMGVSGPAVFALSSIVAFSDYSKEKPLKFTIDLFPNKTVDEVLLELELLVQTYPKKELHTVLGFMVPRSLADTCCLQTQSPSTKAMLEVGKKNLRTIAAWLKGIPLHAIGRGGGDEFVTAGGVDTDEVDPSTMESKLVPNLYFAGEILNIDGFTGGFNLQASWAAGYAAGVAIAGKI